jgi:predicted nucleic acid-binding protein
MITYLDTSAFVKLVIDEEHADEARSWFEESRPAITSVITYPESCSALGRRARQSLEDDSRLEEWLAALNARWSRAVTLEVAPERAGALAAKHGLRGMDAIQLAAAIRVRERLDAQSIDEPLLFATFDRRLLETAEREGFATLGGPLTT